MEKQRDEKQSDEKQSDEKQSDEKQSDEKLEKEMINEVKQNRKYLMNFANDPWDMRKFSPERPLAKFLNEHGLNGIELIQGYWEEGEAAQAREEFESTVKKYVRGVHLPFWPIWLDYWEENESALFGQFGDPETWRNYYRAENKNEFIRNYRKAILEAKALGAEYVVFHVSHAGLEEFYSGAYEVGSRRIGAAFAEMVNEIMAGMENEILLLFENLWYPGLTLLEPEITRDILEGIHYPKKGIMLDIGHLMNTNKELSSEDQAVDYILESLAEGNKYPEEEKSFFSLIKGIHLNSSLSGAYVKEMERKMKAYYRGDSDEMAELFPREAVERDFFREYIASFSHIAKVDHHGPFLNPRIQEVIEGVDPEYVVFEFSASSYEILESQIAQQNIALGRI